MKLELGQLYQVTIIKLVQSGIIVQVGTSTSDTQFIHKSKISKRFVDDISKFVQVGQQLKAEAVVGVINPIELSLLNMNIQPSNSFTPAPKVSAPMTLDDMIAKMNRDFDDKQHMLNRSRKKRRL